MSTKIDIKFLCEECEREYNFRTVDYKGDDDCDSCDDKEAEYKVKDRL